MRQHETRRERECEGYIHLVCHILNLFLSCLEALGKVLVNQSRVKGNKNVSTLSRSSRTRVWLSTFLRTSSHSHLAQSLDECLSLECKPSIREIRSEIEIKFETEIWKTDEKHLEKIWQTLNILWQIFALDLGKICEKIIEIEKHLEKIWTMLNIL